MLFKRFTSEEVKQYRRKLALKVKKAFEDNMQTDD